MTKKITKFAFLVVLLSLFSAAQVTLSGTVTLSGNSTVSNLATPTAPQITTSSPLPTATENTSYTQSLTAAGGATPYVWTISAGALPAGLSLVSSTGVISGIPTAVGTFAPTFQVCDANSLCGTKILSLTVNAPPQLVIQTNPPLATVTQGNAYSAQANVTGGIPPYASCSITTGALPASITLGTTNTAPAGCTFTSASVTDAPGLYNFTVQVSDSASPTPATASGAFSITIQSSSGGPPTFLADQSTDVVPFNDLTAFKLADGVTVANFGGSTKTTQVGYDTSFIGHGGITGTSQLSPVYRCTSTDTFPLGTNQNFSAGVGGSGAGLLWNTNSTILHVNDDGGGDRLILHYPQNATNSAAIHCSPALTENLNLDTPGSANTVHDFGSGNFSQTDASIYYGFHYTIHKHQIAWQDGNFCGVATTAGHFCDLGVVADFSRGLPITPGVTVNPWIPNHSYNFGDYMYYSLNSSEAGDWQASVNTYVLGDLILPLANNTANCVFKLTTVGTTSALTNEPTWSNGTTCGTGVVTDNTAIWRGLGMAAISGHAVFVYQLTSPGTNQISGASISLGGHHPDLRSTITDGTLTWTNSSPLTSIAPGWQSWGGTSFDGNKFGVGFSTQTYGYNGNYTSFVGCSSSCQGNGTYSVQYDTLAHTYHLWDTGTGIETDFLCTGATDPSCTGGTISQASSTQMTTCFFGIHNVKVSYDGTYQLTARQQPLTGCAGTSAYPIWNHSTNVIKFPAFGLNHWALGKTYGIAFAPGGSGLSTGVYANRFPLDTPDVSANWQVIWQETPCDNGAFPTVNPTCNQANLDNHLGNATNVHGTDDSIAASTTYGGLLVQGNVGLPIATPFQNEIVGTTTTPTSPHQYRFTHSAHTQAHPFFDAQFGISQVSQDSQFLAWTTDLGPTSTGTGSFPVQGQTTCFGGYPWKANHTYPANWYIHPIQGLTGSSALYNVFHTVAGGVSGASAPGGLTNSQGFSTLWGNTTTTAKADNHIALPLNAWTAATGEVLGNNIQPPAAKNAGHFIFQAQGTFTTGATSANEPLWSGCQTLNCTISDNGGTWLNVGKTDTILENPGVNQITWVNTATNTDANTCRSDVMIVNMR